MIDNDIFKRLRDKSNKRTMKAFELLRFQKNRKRRIERKKNGEQVKLGAFSKMRTVDLWNVTHHKNVIRATGVNQDISSKKKRKTSKNKERVEYPNIGKFKKKFKRDFTIGGKKIDNISFASSTYSKISARSDFDFKINQSDVFSQDSETVKNYFSNSGEDKTDLHTSKFGKSMIKQSEEIEISDLDFDNVNKRDLDLELQEYFKMEKLGIKRLDKDKFTNSRYVKMINPDKFSLIYVQSKNKIKRKFDQGKKIRFEDVVIRVSKPEEAKKEKTKKIKKKKKNKFKVFYLEKTKKEKLNVKLDALLKDIDKTRTIYDKINEQVKKSTKFDYGKQARKIKKRKIRNIEELYDDKNQRRNLSI